MDIKPENMLLARPDLATHQLYPCVKLADFGKKCERMSPSIMHSDTYRNGSHHWGKGERNSVSQER